LNSTAADFELFTSAHEEIKDYIKLNSLMELFTSAHEEIKDYIKLNSLMDDT
jgi:hypothetical protein